MSEVSTQATQSQSQGNFPTSGEGQKEAIPLGSVSASGGAAPAEAVADKAVEKAQEDYAQRIAQMARRERRMQEESKVNQAKLKEMEAKLAKYDRLKTEPEGVLEEYGWNPEKYLERLATGKTPEPTADEKVKSLADEIAQLRKERDDERSRLTAEREQMAVANFQSKVNTTVKSAPDRYEAILALGEEDLVWQTVQARFAETNELPKIEDVADHVEKYLRGKADKVFGMKAFADRLKPTGQSAIDTKPQQTSSGQTLTATTTAATQPPSTRRKTDEERMADAIAMLEFKK